MKVSRKIKGCFGEVITVFPGTFKGVLKEVSRVFHKSFKEEDALRLFHDFQWCFQSVPECFKSVSKVFQGCSMKACKVFPKSFMLHGTHRSFPSRWRACSFMF